MGVPLCPESLRLKPTNPQAAMLTCPREFPLFVGGYGSGKTQAKLWQAIMECLAYPGFRYGLYSPSFQLMKLSDIPRIIEFFAERRIPIDFNKGDFIFTLPRDSQIILRSIDRPETIVAYETHRAGVDELDTLSSDKALDVWNRIMARTRAKYYHNKKLLQNVIRVYSTPEGFRFCYLRWGRELGPGYARIRAPTSSNAKHLPPDYIQKLEQNYTEQLAQAYLKGHFVNMTTGSVYPDFDRVANHRDTVAQPNDELLIGQDFNVNAMASIVCVTRELDGEETLHAVAEHVKMRDTPAMLKKIGESYRRQPITFYPDAAGDHRNSLDATTTDVSLIVDAGYTVDMPQANPPVKDRIMTMNARFHSADDKRHLFVNTEACPVLTEALETHAYDNKGQPEKPSGPEDPSHVNDALGYVVHRRYGFNRPVFGTVPALWN